MVKTQSASGVDELLRAAEILDNWDREREHGYAAVAPRSSNLQMDTGDTGEPGSSGGSLSSSCSSSGATSSALARACGSSGTHNSSVVSAAMAKANGRRRRHSASGSSSSGRRLSTSSSSPDHKIRGSGKETVQNGFVRSAHNELEKSRRASMRGCLEALRHLLPTEHMERTSTGKNTTLSVLRSARSFIKALHDCLDQKADTRAQLMSEQTKKLHRLSMLTNGMVPPVSLSSVAGSGSIDTMKLETLAVAAATASIAEPSVPRAVSPIANSKHVTISSGNAPPFPITSNNNSFDGSPPVSVIKPGSSIVSSLINNQLSGKPGEKARSISESSTVNHASQPKKIEIEIKRKQGDVNKSADEIKAEGSDFQVVTGDSHPTRVVFVSPINESDELAVSIAAVSTGPRIVATAIRR